MKKLLFLLLLFPFSMTAQEAKKWEVGLNTAAVFSKMTVNRSGDLRWRLNDYYFLANHISLSAYRNLNRVQVGLRVDGGPRDRWNWWVSPQAVVNYKIPFQKLDVYGGGVFGYVREHHRGHSTYSTEGENGLITGLQLGTVIFPGKRIGINLETGVRFRTVYYPVVIVNPVQGTATEDMKGLTQTYIPISLGVRYRF